MNSAKPDGIATRLAHSLPLPAPIRRLENPALGGATTSAMNNRICLTFDDGPDPDYTPKILHLLAEYDVKASFFVVGEAAAQFPQLVQKMLAAGHSLGNHSYSHRHPWLMSAAAAKMEVTRATDIINRITATPLRWFRPPFGRLRTAMRQQAHSEQMATVLWSHSIIDWGRLGTKSGIARRLAGIKAGDIVLMHDGKRKHNHPEVMLQCLPAFLRSLSDRGIVASNLDQVFNGDSVLNGKFFS